MPTIFVPSHGPGDWRALLAEPEKQWARGFSARTLAHCWEDCDDFPAEIGKVLSQHDALASAKPLVVFPEWRVVLPGGSRPSQNDVWVLAKGDDALISIAVEGKVEEPFDRTLGEWKADASRGKNSRLEFLLACLGLKTVPDSIRYQLLHRTASAIIEAERFGAEHAVMLVHSFSPSNTWFADFAAFASVFDLKAEVGHLMTTKARNGMPLHIAWVHGDERYLRA
jgi:hypothetical protein